jgi:hypothetical protein
MLPCGQHDGMWGDGGRGGGRVVETWVCPYGATAVLIVSSGV